MSLQRLPSFSAPDAQRLLVSLLADLKRMESDVAPRLAAAAYPGEPSALSLHMYMILSW